MSKFHKVLDAFAIVVALSASVFAALTIQSDSALAAGGDIRIIAGLATSEVTITPHADACGTAYWHCDEASHPTNTGLDLTNTLGSTTSTYFQSYTYGGYAYAETSNHLANGSKCPGVDIHLWVPYPDSSTGTWVTYIDFVQIEPGIAFGSSFYLASSGWTITYVGSVKQSAPGGGCPWDGIHLHQSGTPRGSSAPYLWTNWGVESDDDPAPNGPNGNQINPTGDTVYNWLHAIQY